MSETPFENIATQLGGAFNSGVQGAISSGLNAVAAPLTALVVLWIIVQGVLVMRGDVDTRQGMTAILKIALVVGLLTSSTGYYLQYVYDFFTVTLRNFKRELNLKWEHTADLRQYMEHGCSPVYGGAGTDRHL
jgi:type IV secretion system protein VirB6